MPIEHWMQFSTFTEQDYFIYPDKATYDGVVLNGNMVTHASNGIAAFLQQKISDETKFIIDPLTHAFQHDPSLLSNSNGEPKSSIKKLAEEFGSPIKDILGLRPLSPSDLESDELLETYTKKVLDFQVLYLQPYMQGADVSKYLDEDELVKLPDAVIPPYFYLTESTVNDWLPIAVKAAKFAKQYSSQKELPKIFVSLVVSQGIIINQDISKRVCDAFSAIDVDGFVVWIDNLDEKSAGSVELVGLLDFCKRLRAEGRNEVINLHGGYFSVLAAGNAGNNCMSGVSHGPEFGEYRSVVPVGGGIPIARYYVPSLHSRERYRDALQLFSASGWLKSSELFHSNVCGCKVCVEVINGDPGNFTKFGDGEIKSIRRKNGIVRINFPSTETKTICLKHYLETKNREYSAASGADKKTLLSELANSENKYIENAGLDGISHLRLWKSVFENFN